MSRSIKVSACTALLASLLLGNGKAAESPANGSIAKKILKATASGKNLLEAGAWHRYEQGFEREGHAFVCDNGSDAQGRRGVCADGCAEPGEAGADCCVGVQSM